ncbi:hypothetical protein K435DRAFT_797670 [Dendrothele bispora CBS 962.96]|uniref:Uncharacterized protein n=1 Tax=Dendrothele bispora (strain CBS 962.96) TaxID=1314807 RepID=A0A4V4HFS0_DENBC|nr:hypothetical protein K435DRAFT_797670 [Dendrothele bispora CBS 962.96]
MDQNSRDSPLMSFEHDSGWGLDGEAINGSVCRWTTASRNTGLNFAVDNLKDGIENSKVVYPEQDTRLDGERVAGAWLTQSANAEDEFDNPGAVGAPMTSRGQVKDTLPTRASKALLQSISAAMQHKMLVSLFFAAVISLPLFLQDFGTLRDLKEPLAESIGCCVVVVGEESFEGSTFNLCLAKNMFIVRIGSAALFAILMMVKFIVQLGTSEPIRSASEKFAFVSIHILKLLLAMIITDASKGLRLTLVLASITDHMKRKNLFQFVLTSGQLQNFFAFTTGTFLTFYVLWTTPWPQQCSSTLEELIPFGALGSVS